jgi:hypothetical protein
MEINVPFRLTADRDGKITGSSPQVPPIRVKLTKATVRTRTSCSNRSHNARATFEGGVTYDSGPKTLRDCQDLAVPLDLIAPGNVTTTLKFVIDGFNVGEVVEMTGTLEYTPFFGFRMAEELELADYAMLPGLKNVTELPSPIPPGPDGGARINACKSVIFLWFARFDVRQKQIGDEIASLLAEDPLIQFPDATLRSKEEFLHWYSEHFPLVLEGYHEISTVQIELEHGVARARLKPTLHALLANKKQVSVQYDIVAELIGVESLNPKIKNYTATPVL